VSARTQRAITSVDVLVVGSGAGGLAAAVAARVLGLQALVVEKAAVFGGTTAWSGGWLWIPGNRHAAAADKAEDVASARTYLAAELGPTFDAARIDAYLEHGPRMVDFFEAETCVRFAPGLATPDFHAASPGASTGRVICALPFDARELGGLVDKLRPPLPEITLMGMAIAAGADLRHFMNATRSTASAWYATRRLARHALDMLRYRRGMHLVNGNALVARLLKAAIERGVGLWSEAAAARLVMRDGAVEGAIVTTRDGDVRVTARCGVVLACGGFPHDRERRRALFPATPTGLEHWSAAPGDNTGDGLRLAEHAGGVVDASGPSAGAWCPVSQVAHRDGGSGVFPHLVDRARPGVIAVRADGRRFVNEADSYHDFMSALFAATPAGEPVEAWLLADHATLRRYGLGFVKPFPFPLQRHLRSGYLVRGDTSDALARACGIDAAALTATLDEYNRGAREGRDDAFGRGSTPFNRFGGDAERAPNPCVAPLERPPFYAVKVVPGSLGTFAGLRTDARGRVVNADGAPLHGLYAVGNDMASIMGGHYPSGGITLGPALTFGYLAALDLAGGRAVERGAQPFMERIER